MLSKKRPFSEKHCSHVIFFKFVWKTFCCHAHIWSKETSTLSNLHNIIGRKSKYEAFFSIFTKKIIYLMPIWQKRPFSKKTNCCHAHIWQKNDQYLKNTVLSCHFFFEFVLKTQLSWPYLVRKVSICQQYWIMDQKSQ